MSIKGTAILRERNQKKVLEYLRKNKMCSRLEISKGLNVSKNTVSLIIDQLIKQGIVVERGSKERKGAGRPSVELSIVPGSFHSIGIYVQSDRIEIMVVDYSITIIEHDEVFIDQEDSLLETVIDCCIKTVNRYKNVIGIGIGVPGLVNPSKGIVHHSTNLNWKDVSLKEKIEQKVDEEVSVFNSVKVAALPAIEDNDEDLHSIFYIRISEGIGGAFIINNKIYLGASRTAGEIGHISVEADGPKCKCGQNGCLERLISLNAFKEAVSASESKAVNSNIGELLHDDSSEYVKKLVKNYGCYLGKAISQVIHLMNPQLVIVDSPYNNVPIFEATTMEVVKENSLELPLEQTIINFVDEVYSPAKGAAISIILNFEN